MKDERIAKLDKFYAGYSKLTKVCNWIGAIALFAMMFLIVADVIFRNIGAPLSGVYEIVQWYLLPISCIPFFGYAYASGVMPRVTMLVEKFKPAVQNKIAIGVLVVNIAMFGYTAYAGWVYAITQLGKGGVVTIGKAHAIVWPLFFLIVLAYLMVAVESIMAILKCFFIKDRKEVTYNE